MQPEEHVPLPKKRRLGRVYVLCPFSIGLHDTTAEGNDFAYIVANGKHDPSTETVVDIALRAIFVARLDQAALQNLPTLITSLERPFQKSVPFVRRETELPILRYPTIDPTLP